MEKSEVCLGKLELNDEYVARVPSTTLKIQNLGGSTDEYLSGFGLWVKYENLPEVERKETSSMVNLCGLVVMFMFMLSIKEGIKH